MSTTAIASWLWGSLQVPMTEVLIAKSKDVAAGTASRSGQKLKRLWTENDWQKAELAYRQKLLSVIRTTKILGNPKEIDIDKIYTDVYVFDKLSAIRRYNESLDEDEVDVHSRLEERQRLDAEEIVKDGGNVFILGRPGAGKTTFLKYLAMNSCKGLNSRTPIFVSLKDWSDSGRGIIDYLVGQFDICLFPDAGPFIESLLKNGQALVLLDGLDEVNEWQDKRNQIIKEIVTFSTKYDDNQFCLTCRTASTDYSFTKFKYVEVADFTDEQQDKFAKQWFGKASPMYQKFSSAWQDERNSGLRELGKTPLLLTLLCLSFDESLSFPKRLVDIYQEAINALTKKWDTSRLIERDKFYKDLSYGQRQQLLETVAAHFYFNSRTVFRRNELAALIAQFLSRLPEVTRVDESDGVEVVRQIESQHGLLVERAHELHTFSHLTIQEYFTASFISRNQDRNILRQVVKSALSDQKWREVILYTVALLPNADAVLEEMRNQIRSAREANLDVLTFLVHCYATSQISDTDLQRRKTSYVQNLIKLRDEIDSYTQRLRQPPLTAGELARFSDQVHVLLDFLRNRAVVRGLNLSAAGVVSAAAAFLKSDALVAGRLLGGYFTRPENFLNFFYSCRLFIECLDVAITSRREEYLDQLLTFGVEEIRRVEGLVRK